MRTGNILINKRKKKEKRKEKEKKKKLTITRKTKNETNQANYKKTIKNINEKRKNLEISISGHF